MDNCYVVLAANTPPNSAKVLAAFFFGTLQDQSTALSQANEYKNNHQPTGTVQIASIPTYNTDVIITT